MFFCSFLKLLNAELFFFNQCLIKIFCAFIDNGLDLKYNKLFGFCSVISFLYNGVELQKSQAKSFLSVVFLNVGPYCMLLPIFHYLKCIHWLASVFCHNKIVQSPPEIDFNLGRKLRRKRGPLELHCGPVSGTSQTGP